MLIPYLVILHTHTHTLLELIVHKISTEGIYSWCTGVVYMVAHNGQDDLYCESSAPLHKYRLV